jgi:hypothetical protein
LSAKWIALRRLTAPPAAPPAATSPPRPPRRAAGLVSPYVPAIAAALTHPALVPALPDDADGPAAGPSPGEEVLLAAGAAARTGVAESVPARLLVPVLAQQLADAAATAPGSAVAHLALLSDVAARLTPQTLPACYGAILRTVSPPPLVLSGHAASLTPY